MYATVPYTDCHRSTYWMVNMHQLQQSKSSEWLRSINITCSVPSVVFNMVGDFNYIFTPTGLSSRNWNGTWRLTFLCSTTRCPRRCDAPTTRTVSPLSKTTSPLASSEIIKEWQYIRNVRLGMIGALQRLGKALSLGTLFVSSFNWLREILSLLKNVCNKDVKPGHCQYEM